MDKRRSCLEGRTPWLLISEVEELWRTKYRYDQRNGWLKGSAGGRFFVFLKIFLVRTKAEGTTGAT